MRGTFAALVLAVLAAGCTTSEDIAAAERRECVELGFEAGSEPYGNCILQLREIRAREQQARAIDQARFRGLYGWGPWYPYPYWW